MRDGTSRRADKPIDARASRLRAAAVATSPVPEIIPSKICKGSCAGGGSGGQRQGGGRRERGWTMRCRGNSGSDDGTRDPAPSRTSEDPPKDAPARARRYARTTRPGAARGDAKGPGSFLTRAVELPAVLRSFSLRLLTTPDTARRATRS